MNATRFGVAGCGIALLCGVMHSTGLAVTLPSTNTGEITVLDSISLASHPELAGSIIYDNSIPYQASVQYPGGLGTVMESGSIRTYVIRESAGGTLDYYFDVQPNQGFGPDFFILTGVGSVPSVEASYFLQPGQAVLPNAAGSYDAGAGKLSFFYVAGDAPMVIRTSQTQLDLVPGTYSFTYASQHVPAETLNVPIWVPNLGASGPAVPEPLGVVLLPVALVALGVRMRRCETTG